MQVCEGCGSSFRGGVPLGMGAVDALRWTRRHASFPLTRKNKGATTLHTHTHTHLLTTHSIARCVSLVSCVCSVLPLALWPCVGI